MRKKANNAYYRDCGRLILGQCRSESGSGTWFFTTNRHRRFLTNVLLIAQTAFVSESENNPLLGVLRWLSQHAGFPKSRLAGHAETLVLLAAAAQALDNEAISGRPNFMVKSRDVARDAALRAHNERRKLVHYKCDNSAKV